jgi:hypothetical protein
MIGDKYDWDVDTGIGELSLEIKTAYSRKSYIDDQAIGTVGQFSQAERSRRIQSNCIISHRSRIAASSSMTTIVGLAVAELLFMSVLSLRAPPSDN